MNWIKTQNLLSQQYDLSVKNPNKKDDTVLRDPKEILYEIAQLDKESTEILKKMSGLLKTEK